MSWRCLLARGREWLRWLNGDTAYQAYVGHLRVHHPERSPPSRAEFYRDEVTRRWNRPRRCC